MKLKLPEITALAAALALSRGFETKIAALATEREELTGQLAAFMEGEAEDEPTLLKVAGLKVRLERLPQTVERLTAQQAAHVRVLIAEIEAFERQLAAAGESERTVLLDHIESLLKPFAPDFTEQNGEVRKIARGLASRCPVLAMIPATWNELNAPPLHHNANGPQAAPDAQARAEALLSIHATVARCGSFLAPGTIPKTTFLA